MVALRLAVSTQMPVFEKVMPCQTRLSGPPIHTSSLVRSRYWLKEGRPSVAVTVRAVAVSALAAWPVTVTTTLELTAVGATTLMA